MLSLYPWTKLSKDFIWAINKKLTINNKFRKPFDWETVPLIDWSQSCVTNCIKIILTVEELSPTVWNVRTNAHRKLNEGTD